jgi:hypothetical protein
VAPPRLNGKQIYMLGLMIDKFPEFPEFPNYPGTLEEPTPLATDRPFSPVSNPLNDAFEMSQLMDACNSDLLDICFNGFGAVMMSTDKPHHQVVMTTSRCSAFLESGDWSPWSHFHSLPFVWQMKSKKPHYFADLVFANTVIANELGFGGPIEYLKSHGWMYIVKKGGTKTLQYKSLSNTIFQTVPLGCVATHGIHFKAMIKKLYEIIKGNGIKDVYKGMDMVHFLQEDRFCQRLHLYTQEFQFGVLFVEKFFLPHVKSNIGDTVFWMKKDNTKTILSLSTTSSPSFWMVVTPNSQLTSWQTMATAFAMR